MNQNVAPRLHRHGGSARDGVFTVRAFSTIAAAAFVVCAGCEMKTVDPSVSTPSVVAAPVSGAPFRIIATDGGFEAPDSILAGLRHIVFENKGTEVHEAMLVKLPDGMGAADYVAAVKAGSEFPPGALDYSGPGLTSPGESVEMWLTVDPGRYILICWNSGHATSRPVHDFVVQDGRADEEPPKEDLVVKLFDYRFEIDGALKKGLQVIRFETPGPGMHEADLFRLDEGTTVEDLKRWRKQGGRGDFPARALGGKLDGHDITRAVWLRKTFTPGRYVLHCEMPMPGSAGAADADAETTHADVGMVREFEIAE